MTTWRTEAPAEPLRVTPLGLGLALLRGTALAGVTYGGLLVLLALRLVERPLFGAARPLSPAITRVVCRAALVVIGIRYEVRGVPMRGMGAVVANHGSWLDIFALNACQRVAFVSKAEVARWPAIGWLARATGTVFIARERREAAAQKRLLEARIRSGQRLLFFPEGTSTDGLRVLGFKPTLFAAFFAPGHGRALWVQPVSVIYRAPPGRSPRFYGWWGEMDFGPHLFKTLAEPRQGGVTVILHDAVRVDDFASRKDLAAHCEAVIRAGHAAALARG